MRKPLILAIILGICLSTMGCLGYFSSNEGSPSDFFPLTEGSYWIYRGEGNEYASFSREVVAVREDKAQVREDNGGTVSVAIYKKTDQAVTRIYFQGEAYEGGDRFDQEPNDSQIILQAPLKKGTTWERDTHQVEITQVGVTVETFTGTFTNCIQLQITSENFTVYEYFKEQVGLVKREFVADNMRITSTLEEYFVE